MTKNLILIALVVGFLVAGGYLLVSNFLTTKPSASSLPASALTPPVLPTVSIVRANLNADGIPTDMGGLSLTKSVRGKGALNDLAGLHPQRFDLMDGFRADYGSGDRAATLWVGRAQDAGAAQQLVSAMAGMIGSSNTIFTDLHPLNISGRQIYQVTGQAQLHFFYAVNDKVVWLASDPSLAAETLHSIWGVIK